MIRETLGSSWRNTTLMKEMKKRKEDEDDEKDEE